MKISRLILLTLLGCSCGLTAAAQTAAGRAKPTPSFRWPAVDVPYAGQGQSLAAPGSMRVYVGPPLLLHPGEPVHLAQNDRLCYSLRTYHYTRDAAGSDSTSLTGKGTCAPSTTVHEKGIGSSPR